ncbi:MAG TPA: hypothetical protein VG734_25595 [Lacunisphaera sp.]|nr:hypothetical protein [Lacunisphaera sp.]
MSRITEAQAQRIARNVAQMVANEPEVEVSLKDPAWLASVLLGFSEGTERGEASAAEERQAQRESIRDAVWSWMARVYARCPRLELGETMELKIIADQSGFCSPGLGKGDEFEAFTFRIESTTTEGEF